MGSKGGKTANEVLTAQIKKERLAAKLEVIKKMRFLTSCDAEAMNEYQRINALVKWGHEACVLLETE